MKSHELYRLAAFILCVVGTIASPSSSEAQDVASVRFAMHRAVKFFREDCASEGGYVYRWSADLAKREGEGKVDEQTAWIEPPGTPAVGIAFLEAYERCGDEFLLDAAKETANALVRGQLESGGWDNRIVFGASGRSSYAYRSESASLLEAGTDRRRNVTTFDDDKSQSAARFLMRLDQTLEFTEPVVHEASMYALNRFVDAQYANGAWPQRYDRLPPETVEPSLQARIPSRWSRTYPGNRYAAFYTLNDNTISDLIRTMLDAWEIYGDRRYLESAVSGGQFLIQAQLPEPQPGWAQQYDREMRPAWARRFEPPAVTGGESQGVMRTLIMLYRRTASEIDDAERFLEPIPRAIRYYRRSLRSDGRLARFYELGSNRPIYFTTDYQLTYNDDDMPTHYSFVVTSRLDSIERELAEVRRLSVEDLWPQDEPRIRKPNASMNRRVQLTVDSLDERGAWVEEGRLRYHGDDDPTRQVITSATFIKNLNLLSNWIASHQSQ